MKLIQADCYSMGKVNRMSSRRSRHRRRKKNSELAKKEVINEASKEQGTGKPKRLFYFRRRFPIPLRVLVITAALAVSLALGLVVGFGVIGDGEPKDALKKETWQHIVDIVKKE